MAGKTWRDTNFSACCLAAECLRVRLRGQPFTQRVQLLPFTQTLFGYLCFMTY